MSVSTVPLLVYAALLATVIGSIAHRKVIRDWWLILMLGLCSIAVGVLAFSRPSLTALLLLLFIAARALIVGSLEIAASIAYRRRIHGDWLLALSGVISVIFGLLVWMELVMISFTSPALTSGAISLERERQTFDPPLRRGVIWSPAAGQVSAVASAL